MNRVVDHIQGHLADSLDLEQLAAVACFSPFHFHRRFTELMGLTPKHFLLECQIHAAKTQLLAGEKELAQIAADTSWKLTRPPLFCGLPMLLNGHTPM